MMVLMVIHRYIREDADRSSCIKRAVGNVTADTEITFEYGIRTRNHDHRGTSAVCMHVCVYLLIVMIMLLKCMHTYQFIGRFLGEPCLAGYLFGFLPRLLKLFHFSSIIWTLSVNIIVGFLIVLAVSVQLMR